MTRMWVASLKASNSWHVAVGAANEKLDLDSNEAPGVQLTDWRSKCNFLRGLRSLAHMGWHEKYQLCWRDAGCDLTKWSPSLDLDGMIFLLMVWIYRIHAIYPYDVENMVKIPEFQVGSHLSSHQQSRENPWHESSYSVGRAVHPKWRYFGMLQWQVKVDNDPLLNMYESSWWLLLGMYRYCCGFKWLAPNMDEKNMTNTLPP